MWVLLVSSSAEQDVAEGALWYENQQIGLGKEFIAEVEKIFQVLKRDPERVCLHYPTQQVRRILTHRFPYHVYYYIEEQTIRVFAIVHTARHSRQWKRRR